MNDSTAITGTNSQGRGSLLRVILLLVFTVAFNLFAMLAPDYLLDDVSLVPYFGLLLFPGLPTLWAILLLIRYRKNPEKIVAYVALAPAAFWWGCFLIGSWLRP